MKRIEDIFIWKLLNEKRVHRVFNFRIWANPKPLLYNDNGQAIIISVPAFPQFREQISCSVNEDDSIKSLAAYLISRIF
jgi:hypothetical protein